jgi:hypothetical protein
MTLEALEGLDEGAEILVRSRQLGNRQWTKAASGEFVREGAGVPASFFTGYIAEGRVTKVDNTPARPGDWYMQTRYDYYIWRHNTGAATDTAAAGTIHCLTFHNGELRGEYDYDPETFSNTNGRIVRQEGLPERVRANPDSMRRLLGFIEDDLAATRVQLQQARDVKPPDMSEKDAMIERLVAVIRDVQTAVPANRLVRNIGNAVAVAREALPEVFEDEAENDEESTVVFQATGIETF